jgi:phage terminase small subunit
MPRRRQPLEIQEAMGFPGRRPGAAKKAKRAIDAALAAIEAEPVVADPFAPPAYFRRSPAYYRRALELWAELSAVLRSAGRRRPGYRQALARYCLWSQIEEEAFETLRKQCPKHDYTIEWTPVNGTPRQGVHPAFTLMQQAQPICRELELQFGFTPKSDGDLERVESFNRSQGRLPFDMPTQRASGPAATSDPMDLMTSTDTVPSGSMN